MRRARFVRPLLVRVARLEDAEALHDACFPDQAHDWVLDYLHWCLAAPGRPTRLVAWLGEELVAHVELTPRQGGAWAELSSLVVAEPWRRQGIGQRVVQAAVRLARRWGCAQVRLQVASRAKRLLALYRRWGFYQRGAPLAGYCWLALDLAPLPAPVPVPALATLPT